jgi:hypothetical protein
MCCWGINTYGEASPPTGTFNRRSAGSYFACGLESGGDVECWGDDVNDHPRAPDLVVPVPITVMVSGSQTDATTPVFSETNNAPAGVTVNDSALACSEVEPSTTISPALSVADDTVLVSSCSGATVSNTADYVVQYQAVTGGYVVTAPTIVVSPAPPVADATWESPYAPVTFSATGGVGPYTFSVPTNSLPTGLSLDPTTGVLSGTPTAKSQIGTTFSFTVTATDAWSFTGTGNYSITLLSSCAGALTPYFLSATSLTGNFTGVFCVNGSGTGTYTQSGGPSGTGTVTSVDGSTQVTAFGTNLALLGETYGSFSTFTETAPAPETAGTFTLS